jgi:hypothetical protein
MNPQYGHVMEVEGNIGVSVAGITTAFATGNRSHALSQLVARGYRGCRFAVFSGDGEFLAAYKTEAEAHERLAFFIQGRP